ncbi:hypothetical protein [Ectobacillus ponti]|uniref:Uncharacterized protein n=1 Tax=Ectobacillus ponti TaxID=2961894 RepID=A0AA41X876_9BACI|nr:hypothetical protein [Ectobacillus ponti]MCP8970679.1 hypothetical protein [Ectobacillus ponti]
MRHIGFQYEKKERKNGTRYISIRDVNENKLLEIEQRGEDVVIYTNSRNESATTFVLPKEMLDRVFGDLSSQ